MSTSAPRGEEEPLNNRPRLSVPREPVGEKPTRFANMALGLYAAFCNIVGLVFTLTGAFLSESLGASGTLLTLFGIFVLLWSFMVTLYANRRVTRRPELERVVRANVIIAAVSIVWLLLSNLTRAGNVMTIMWIAAVLVFTTAQLLAREGL